MNHATSVVALANTPVTYSIWYEDRTSEGQAATDGVANINCANIHDACAKLEGPRNADAFACFVEISQDALCSE